MDAERGEETEQLGEETMVDSGEEIPQIELRDLQAERDPMGAGRKGSSDSGTTKRC